MKKLCYVVTLPVTIEAFFIPQLKYLSEHGFEVHVICSYGKDLQFKLGSEIKYIPVEIPRGISVLGTFKSIFKLTKIFRYEKYDLIQYSTPNAAFYSSIAATIAGCKVRNYHLMGLRYLGSQGFMRFILKTLEKITCKFSTFIECVSKSNMELGIKEKLFSKDKVTVVWNGSTGGVDLSRFDYSKRESWRQDIRRQLGYKKDDFIYGFVGRITRDKGINELLSAFFNLNDDSKLLLIGNIEDNNHLDESLIDKARLDKNIKFVKFVKDIERYYAALDVLVLPSYREGFGNVVIEAGAVGTPAIVTNISGPIDTIERDKTALVVPVKDSVALTNGLKKIHNMDYVKMGNDAAKFTKNNFENKKLCKKILERKMNILN